jgi:hypothetical protein
MMGTATSGGVRVPVARLDGSGHAIMKRDMQRERTTWYLARTLHVRDTVEVDTQDIQEEADRG